MKKMRVYVALLLAFVMLLSACGGQNAESTAPADSSEVSESVATEESASEESAEDTTEETAEEAEEDTTGDATNEYTTDVLVIGAGGTGLSAAASAHEHGADVLVIEKLAVTGGSTSYSGGGIAATGTNFQEAQGIEDTKEDWMNLWKERQATSNEGFMYPDYDLVDQFMDEAIITTNWLEDYVGHEYDRVEGFGFDPAPRLHFPENGGAELTSNIKDFLDEQGVEILLNTSATELITDENNAVIGAKAEGENGEITINAKKVILATGGFAKNQELIDRFIPDSRFTAELSAAAPGSLGEGITMAEAVGAVVYEEPWIIGLSVQTGVPELQGLEWDASKLYVNETGERFMNEAQHYSIVTNTVAAQADAFAVFDSTTAPEGLADVENPNLYKGETIEELAEAMGVDSQALATTIETYNAGVEAGEDALGKPESLLAPIAQGPFYAARIMPFTMGTFGGVKTNTDYQVLNENGEVIENLYAGGEVANRPLYNQVYMSGSAVQVALTSGRIAGEHAANNLAE